MKVFLQSQNVPLWLFWIWTDYSAVFVWLLIPCGVTMPLQIKGSNVPPFLPAGAHSCRMSAAPGTPEACCHCNVCAPGGEKNKFTKLPSASVSLVSFQSAFPMCWRKAGSMCKQSFESSPEWASAFLHTRGRRRSGKWLAGSAALSGVNNTRGRPRVPEPQRQHVHQSPLSVPVSSCYLRRPAG